MRAEAGAGLEPRQSRGDVRQRRRSRDGRRADQGGPAEHPRSHAPDVQAHRRVRPGLQPRLEEQPGLHVHHGRLARRRRHPHAPRGALVRAARGRRLHPGLRHPRRGVGGHEDRYEPPGSPHRLLRSADPVGRHARHDLPAAEEPGRLPGDQPCAGHPLRRQRRPADVRPPLHDRRPRRPEDPNVMDAAHAPVITSAIRVPDEMDSNGLAGERGFYLEDAGQPEFVSWMLQPQAPTKGPVLLVHGVGVRTEIWRPPPRARSSRRSSTTDMTCGWRPGGRAWTSRTTPGHSPGGGARSPAGGPQGRR